MGSLRNGTETERCGEDEEGEEPILKEQNQRFCMFPIRYKQLWEMYKKAEASFWTGTIILSVLSVLLSLLFPCPFFGFWVFSIARALIFLCAQLR